MDGALAADRMLSCSGHGCMETHGGKSHHRVLWDTGDAVGTQECCGKPRMLWDEQNPRDAAG